MVLAFAERSDTSDFGLMTVILIYIALGAAVGGLALAPIGLARWRRNPGRDGVLTVTLFWSVLTIASLVYAANLQLRWSKERDMRFSSGYYTQSQESSDAPPQPISIWVILGAIYLVLLIWASYPGPKSTRPR